MIHDSYVRLDFTDRDFDFIRDLVAKCAGISLNTGKRELVYSRLARRVKDRGLQTFRDYCDLLRTGDTDELNRCINALTTNVTAFFREDHHFEYLGATVVPEIMQRVGRTGARRLRVWSAGCSSGEEPYSIEMTLRDHPVLDSWDVRILATDLDSNMLERARTGIYRTEQIEKVSIARRQRWFMRGEEGSGRVKIRPDCFDEVQALLDKLSGEK